MLRFIRTYGWLIFFCVIIWICQYFIPPALQGASSEIGQDIYAIATKINSYLNFAEYL